MSILADNINAQPESLDKVLAHHEGAGREALTQAATLLRSRKNIVITGMGASLFAAMPLQYALAAQGRMATLVEAGELLHYLKDICTDSVIVIVSRSGESIEIAKLLAFLKGSAPVIGISNKPQSRLAADADVSISLASLDDGIVAIQTYTATLLTLSLLASATADTLITDLKQARDSQPAFRSLVQASLDSLEHWDPFFAKAPNLYLLARGPSIASAHAGSLLLHEVAKSPAVAMPIASFRHGPVEVVDAKFRGIIFAPKDTTQELNLGLAKDILRFGGQAKVIGPSTPLAPDLPYLELPPLPPSLAPIFEIVPLQAAALRLAQLRGVVPGSFRFAPPVAVDEESFTDLPLSR